MFKRNPSKQRLPDPSEESSPSQVPKSPFQRKDIDDLIFLEGEVVKSRLTDDIIAKLMGFYTVVIWMTKEGR